MNVLLVDDQQAIVDSLKQNIHWDEIPVKKVYTASSAKEAKMILRNFAVDVLITDIEMPEEDGISLFRWAREHMPNLEGVFLTSHADFEYVREAIHMGGFDYILQPVRNSDVEDVLKRLLGKLNKSKHISYLESAKELIYDQRNTILDGLMLKVSQGRKDEANQLFENFPALLGNGLNDAVIRPILVQVVRWKGISDIWNDKLMRFMLCNVMEELFEIANPSVAISGLERNTYWILLTLEKGTIDEDFYRHRLDDFSKFVEANMEIKIAIYPWGEPTTRFWDMYEQLNAAMADNTHRHSGVFWKQGEAPGKPVTDEIEQAKRYISNHINRKVTRQEVAAHVHLNESYFSRLFHQQTGLTFKDYIMYEKMERAKELLRESKLSVSIVASKVGSDNFSHFCKMFKKITNHTPQEYRRRHEASR